MIGAAIRAIRPLVREINIAYLHWARKEMKACHADMPFVVLRLSVLESERRSQCQN
jgi:hypothetical protein